MFQGFVKGVLGGGVLAVLGLAVVSQLAPAPETAVVTSQNTPTGSETAPAAAPAVPPETDPAPVDPATPETAEVPAEVPAAAEPAMAEPTPLTDTPPANPQMDAPATPAAPEASDTPAEPGAADPQPATSAAGDQPAAPQSEPAPAAGDAPAPAPDAAPAPLAPSTLADDAPSTLAPAGSLADQAGAVTTGRLPSIGGAAEEPGVSPQSPATLKYARAFAGANGKPLFVILLRDIGAAGMDRAQLAALPFPVSFVIDPAAPDAAEAARTYRDAGQEVLMLATGIPEGATAGDLEQTFQSHAAILPETVALIDTAASGFQDNRPLSSLVVPLIKAQGRGLVTFDRGLNAADQVARREDVPAAVIFRSLDGEGETVPLIRRYLDRATFKAAQEGKVVVIGDTRAETVAAILEWKIEGRAANVTLAPLTAVMSVN